MFKHDITIVMIHCFGMLAMSLIMPGAALPRPGKILLGEAYHLRPAGAAVNVAVAARRAGANDVRLYAVVGEDEFGKKLMTHLQTQKLNLNDVVTQSGMTALMHYAVQRGGQAQASLSVGVAAAVRAENLKSKIQAGDHVMVDVMANAQQAYAVILAAHQKQATPYLYYTHGAVLPDDEILHAAVWLLTDMAGAETLAQMKFQDDLALKEWAAEYGLRYHLNLAIQLSPAETMTFTFQGGFLWRGLKTEAVDFTGAPEAWFGTLITALAAGLPENRALARAAAAASLATLALGPQDAMVQNQTLAEWLPDLPEPERIS
jgi:ribokinase